VSTWLKAWRNRDEREPTGPIMELLVVAGTDAGNRFTLEGDEVLVGRGKPESGQTDVIRLEDKSISRKQAWIRRDASGTSIEHIGSASNPTFVNGLAVGRARLAVGDRIEMGRVAIDVRARDGMNLRALTEIMEDAARESTITGAQRVPARDAAAEETTATSTHGGPPLPEKDLAAEVTDVRPMRIHAGELNLLRGADSISEASFPIFVGLTTIGRGDGVDVQIPELGVSRLHAEISAESHSVRLIPKSRTNPTLVNGFPVDEAVELADGDEIQLADRVVIEVRLSSGLRNALERRGRAKSELSQKMEHKIDLDRRIEEFNVMGSFLDVDVVSSRAMKRSSEKAEHIIVSFERFRSYVGGICKEWNGQILNSNGDELMCFFESALSAVLAGSAILERLGEFNRHQNLLGRDFQFRLGAHTGVSLVDLDAGIAYSEVLDTAGHIQKLAEPNTLVVSQTTLDSLPGAAGAVPATPVGEMTGVAGPLYRIDRALHADDFGA
jgi:pSer/pThr/pTyr-binding forkhead associated (FHA) protein